MALSDMLLTDKIVEVITGPVGLAFSLTLIGALGVGALRMRKNEIVERAENPPIGPDIPREKRIPVVQHDPDQVDRSALMNRVSHLAVDGRWDELAADIAHWEGKLESTPGGARYHEIAVETCLTGLRTLLDEAPREALSALSPAERETQRFVERYNTSQDDHILAVLAAEAHLMMAENYQPDFWPDDTHEDAAKKRGHHLLQAKSILGKMDPVERMSPLVAGAAYALARQQQEGRATLLPTFEDWVDLDPSNPRIYAAHVPHLLEADDEETAFAALMAEAERSQERTESTLGEGGFALCVVPALAEDNSLRDKVPADRLAGGLIALARSSATQAEVNIIASELAEEIALSDGARRDVMQSAFDTIVQHDLSVIYPRLWAADLDKIRELLADVFERTGGPLPGIGRLYAPISRRSVATT